MKLSWASRRSNHFLLVPASIHLQHPQLALADGLDGDVIPGLDAGVAQGVAGDPEVGADLP